MANVELRNSVDCIFITRRSAATYIIRHSSFPTIIPLVLQIDGVLVGGVIGLVPGSVFHIEGRYGSAIIDEGAQ